MWLSYWTVLCGQYYAQFLDSNKLILYIKVLKMVMFRMLANTWVHMVWIAFYLFYKQPSVCLPLAVLTAQSLVRLSKWLKQIIVEITQYSLTQSKKNYLGWVIRSQISPYPGHQSPGSHIFMKSRHTRQGQSYSFQLIKHLSVWPLKSKVC